MCERPARDRLVDEQLHHHELVDRHPRDALEQRLEARVELVGAAPPRSRAPTRPPRARQRVAGEQQPLGPLRPDRGAPTARSSARPRRAPADSRSWPRPRSRAGPSTAPCRCRRRRRSRAPCRPPACRTRNRLMKPRTLRLIIWKSTIGSQVPSGSWLRAWTAGSSGEPSGDPVDAEALAHRLRRARRGRSRRRSRCRCPTSAITCTSGRGSARSTQAASSRGISSVIPLPRSGRSSVIRATRPSTS